MTARYFEDYAVGQRFDSGSRAVTEQDLTSFTEISGDRNPLHTEHEHALRAGFDGPVLQGPFGLAVVFGLLHELRGEDEAIVAVLDSNWRYLAPIRVGDALRFAMTITSCRRTSEGDRGVVNRHVVLLNQHDERVQEGTTAVLVRARDTADPASDDVSRQFATAAWAEALADRLGADERFTSATSSWDGTIGLRCGEQEVHLRLYRGRVIEATRRAPHGATFTVGAPELVWTELITGPRNDFMQRVMRGQFDVSGSGYEYLRLTKVLHVLIDNARDLAAEGANR